MPSPVFPWPQARQRLLQRLAGTRANHDPAQWRLGLAPLADADSRVQALLPDALRPSAVLIPLIDRPDGPGVLLTVRASGLRHHAGQVAFPGGHIETHDASPAATALREAQEEVGLSAEQVQVVGFLPDHVILSGFRVTPVVALVQPQAELRWDPAEVAGAFELPLAVLLDAEQHSVGSRLINDVPVVTRDILYGSHRIWGATAAMLFCLRAWAIDEDLS